MRLLQEIKITLDIDEIFNLLRANNKSKNEKKPSINLLDEINEQIEESLELIKPTGIFDIFESEKINCCCHGPDGRKNSDRYGNSV